VNLFINIIISVQVYRNVLVFFI